MTTTNYSRTTPEQLQKGPELKMLMQHPTVRTERKYTFLVTLNSAKHPPTNFDKNNVLKMVL